MYPFPGGKCSTDFFHTKCCNKKCSPSTHLVSNRLAQCPACQYYGPCHPVPANCWNVLAVFLHKMLSLLWEIVRIVGCHFQPLRVENYRAMFGQCSPRILKSVGSKPERWFAISVLFLFLCLSIEGDLQNKNLKQQSSVCLQYFTNLQHDRSAYVGVTRAVVPARSRQDPRLEG